MGHWMLNGLISANAVLLSLSKCCREPSPDRQIITRYTHTVKSSSAQSKKNVAANAHHASNFAVRHFSDVTGFDHLSQMFPILESI